MNGTRRRRPRTTHLAGPATKDAFPAPAGGEDLAGEWSVQLAAVRLSLTPDRGRAGHLLSCCTVQAVNPHRSNTSMTVNSVRRTTAMDDHRRRSLAGATTKLKAWLQLRFDFDSTAERKNYTV